MGTDFDSVLIRYVARIVLIVALAKFVLLEIRTLTVLW
jgi:hypothetical protein